MNTSIANIRKDYCMQSLGEKDTAENPFQQFTQWWKEAINSNIEEVNAMTLATATKEGKPSARIVLLKEYTDIGFVFYTNYNSKKGNQIDTNPYASLLFFWKELERQVRIDGNIEKVSEAESDAYFLSRPLGSRIGAWASPQSKVIADRTVLEENEVKYKTAFGDIVARPEHWGGYIVKPTLIEFWQGRSNRLHDRIQYRIEENAWIKERLAP